MNLHTRRMTVELITVTAGLALVSAFMPVAFGQQSAGQTETQQQVTQ